MRKREDKPPEQPARDVREPGAKPAKTPPPKPKTQEYSEPKSGSKTFEDPSDTRDQRHRQPRAEDG